MKHDTDLSAAIKALAFPPRLLSEAEAASYLGRSQTRFRELVDKNVLPAPSDRNGNRRLWDRRILDRYVDALSGLGEAANPWDEL